MSFLSPENTCEPIFSTSRSSSTPSCSSTTRTVLSLRGTSVPSGNDRCSATDAHISGVISANAASSLSEISDAPSWYPTISSRDARVKATYTWLRRSITSSYTASSYWLEKRDIFPTVLAFNGIIGGTSSLSNSGPQNKGNNFSESGQCVDTHIILSGELNEPDSNGTCTQANSKPLDLCMVITLIPSTPSGTARLRAHPFSSHHFMNECRSASPCEQKSMTISWNAVI